LEPAPRALAPPVVAPDGSPELSREVQLEQDDSRAPPGSPGRCEWELPAALFQEQDEPREHGESQAEQDELRVQDAHSQAQAGSLEPDEPLDWDVRFPEWAALREQEALPDSN
jgi:hypothetical protein